MQKVCPKSAQHPTNFARKLTTGAYGLRTWLINTIAVSNLIANSQSIRDLRLHESQEETERNEEYSIFTFHLRPTFDFQQEILWNGEDVEVLEPLRLRKEIARKIKRMWNKYKEDK